MKVSYADIDSELERINAFLRLPDVKVIRSAAYGHTYIELKCGAGVWSMGAGGTKQDAYLVLRDRDFIYECFRKGVNHLLFKFGTLELPTPIGVVTLERTDNYRVTLMTDDKLLKGDSDDLIRLAFWYLSKPE